MGDDVPVDVEMIFQGELALLIGLIFEGIKGSGELRKQASKQLAGSIEEGTDSDHSPHVTLLRRFPYWLGSLTRSLTFARLFDFQILDEKTRQNLLGLMKHAISMTRADGQVVLAQVPQSTWLSIVCQLGSELGWEDNHPSMILLKEMSRNHKTVVKQLPTTHHSKSQSSKLATDLTGTNVKASSADSPSYPSTQTDWGKMAHLRTTWDSGADLFSIAYEANQPLIEFSPRGQVAFSGAWDISIAYNNLPIRLEDEEWSCTCWYTDEEVDYLELQMNLEGQPVQRINRTILLSRDQQFLYVCDAVQVEESGLISYQSRWQTKATFEATKEHSSRQLFLQHADQKQQRLHVLPLAQPMSKGSSPHGTLAYDQQSLTWTAQKHQLALCVPMLFDWHGSNAKNPGTWQTVTVAEEGKRLSEDVAVGYLAHLHKRVIVFFHSLWPGRFGRSFLGHHTHHETVIGEFMKDGSLRPLVHIETPEESSL